MILLLCLVCLLPMLLPRRLPEPKSRSKGISFAMPEDVMEASNAIPLPQYPLPLLPQPDQPTPGAFASEAALPPVVFVDDLVGPQDAAKAKEILEEAK